VRDTITWQPVSPPRLSRVGGALAEFQRLCDRFSTLTREADPTSLSPLSGAARHLRTRAHLVDQNAHVVHRPRWFLEIGLGIGLSAQTSEASLETRPSPTKFPNTHCPKTGSTSPGPPCASFWAGGIRRVEIGPRHIAGMRLSRSYFLGEAPAGNVGLNSQSLIGSRTMKPGGCFLYTAIDRARRAWENLGCPGWRTSQAWLQKAAGGNPPRPLCFFLGLGPSRFLAFPPAKGPSILLGLLNLLEVTARIFSTSTLLLGGPIPSCGRQPSSGPLLQLQQLALHLEPRGGVLPAADHAQPRIASRASASMILRFLNPLPTSATGRFPLRGCLPLGPRSFRRATIPEPLSTRAHPPLSLGTAILWPPPGEVTIAAPRLLSRRQSRPCPRRPIPTLSFCNALHAGHWRP